ncbi:MAG: hypothetical protein CMD15_02820 [Flavobacteriales bacterium]|nr:hypothetical protein [Flavobacteriales bacterium]|tara:strand:- start:7001 stop:7546 length:546 start_codon:yes stop_codon:yes gene_type:complete
MRKYLLIIFCIPFIVFGQSHTIDEHLIQMTGTTNDADLTENTFYNAQDTCYISWNIINDSMPNGWDYSICFPDCFPIGITNGQDIFYPNVSEYLNCHMYHYGTPGFGIVEMEITTNNQVIDTIKWTGTVDVFTSTNSIYSNKNKEIVNIINIVGKQTKISQNSFLIYVYDDGTFEKKIIIR